MTKPLLGVLTCVLVNQLCVVSLHSSINESLRRNFLGFVVAPRRKLDFHHSSLGCPTLMCSLASPSYSGDDAHTSPGLPVLQMHVTPKQRWRLGSTFEWDEHGKRQIDSRLVPNVLFQLPNQMVYPSELLDDVQPFMLVFPYKIQPVKTDPPPIQHSLHNPQKELLHIIEQHQKLLSKRVHKSIEHGPSCNMSFW